MTQPAANFDPQRGEVFKDRRLAIAYLEMANRLMGLFEESRVSKSGNIELDAGKVSKGLEAASGVAGAFSSIAAGVISAAAKIAGFFRQKEITQTHNSTLDLAGDASPEDCAKFARELALKITLENKEHIQENIKLESGVNPSRRAAVSDTARDTIKKRSKEMFGKVLDEINSGKIEIDPEFGITDESSRKKLIEQLSQAARTPSKHELAQEAMRSKDPHREHKDLGPHTHQVIAHEHPHLHGKEHSH